MELPSKWKMCSERVQAEFELNEIILHRHLATMDMFQQVTACSSMLTTHFIVSHVMLSTESQLCMSRVSYVLCQSVIYGEQEDIAQNILADIAPSIIWLYKNELSMSFWMMVFL